MTLFLIFVLLPLTAVNLVFVVEVAAGLFWVRPRAAAGPGNASRVVIVPAHDEAAIIADTLRALVLAVGDPAEILVVADNCRDSTAAVAKSCGVKVTERFDEMRRGKGFALDHARSFLASDPPLCVIVVDADCTIDCASINALSAACASGRPGQAVYLLQPEPKGSPFLQISTFAFCLKNLVRQRGLQRLARRVHLTGTGMAFPWPVFALARLATASIVEDLQLGLDLAEQGHPAQLVPNSTVWSAAASEAETLEQRRRWEGGFLTTAMRTAPRALAQALARGDLRGGWAALDLFVPPVALLVIVNLVFLVAGGAFAILSGAGRAPLFALATSSVAVGAVVILVWAKEGRSFVSMKTLLSAPVYVIRKLGLYATLARNGAPAEWRRTERDGK